MDLRNGNDSNAGTYLSPWLTFANGPTSARIASGDDVRIMRTNVATLANTTWTNGSATVTIPANTILDINQATATTGWVASANVTLNTSSTRKLGSTSLSVAVGAAFTTGKIAYVNFSTLNLSAYQNFSFNLQSSGAISSGWLTVRLCSDTTGDTPVHTFTVPQMALNVMYQFTFYNGSALSSSIQSVSIFAATDPGSITLLVNNIIAHNDLGLGSLVGVGDESFYPVKGITGTTLTIDVSNNASGTNGTWIGTSGTYAMTIREAVYTQSAQIAMNEGSNTSYYTLSGGWENETTQNGYTIVRNTGFTPGQNGWLIENVGAINTSTAFNIGSILVKFKSIVAANCSSSALNISASGHTQKIPALRFYMNFSALSNASNFVLICSDSHFAATSALTAFNGHTYFNCIFRSNTNLFSAGSSGITSLKNCTITASGIMASPLNYQNGIIVEENTAGSSYPVVMTFSNAIARWQTTVKQGSDPGAWEITSLQSARHLLNPIEFKIAEIYCTSGVAKTVSVWAKKNHATNTGLSIFAEGGRLNGVNETEEIKDNDTSWQQLSITFTPSESGVIGIYARAWFINAAADMHIGSLTES